MTLRLTRKTILDSFIPNTFRTTAKITPYSPRDTDSGKSDDRPPLPYHLIKFDDLVELMKSEPRLPTMKEAKKRGILAKYEDIDE